MAVEEDCAVSEADGEVGEGGGEGYGCYLVWALSCCGVDDERGREGLQGEDGCLAELLLSGGGGENPFSYL